MSTIGSTVTAGIQDISALLPLLGTEQCETLLGSALLGGYLYVAVTSISIFGSLGIVRAGFKALAASLSYKSLQFQGAKKLHSAGFNHVGGALTMILLDEERYFAETQLLSMLSERHIDVNVDINDEDKKSPLTVQPECAVWNIKMIISSLAMAILGMAPYVHLNIRDHVSLPVFSRWVFPIARILGSLITANMVQFIIQIRVIDIIRYRIVFIRLQKRIYELSESTRKNLMENVRWDAKYSSEECIWSLDEYLKRYSDESYQHLTNVLGNEMHNQSLTASALRQIAIIFIQMVLFGGLILSVVGYIGCFSLVQNSGNRTTGPLIWLFLEVLLSLMRMFLWAWDPEWDESAGIKFDLQLKPGAPLITCHKDPEEIDEERILPLTRDTIFLSEVTSHTGLLERVNDDRITLYYSLTGDKNGRRLLYIVICDYKEGISRVYVKRGDTSQSSSSEMINEAEGSSRASSISSRQIAPEQNLSSGSIQVDDEDGSISATMKDGFAKAETNPFTENKDFMEKLKWHYNSILDLLENTGKRCGASLNSLSISNASSIPRNWRVEGFKPKKGKKTEKIDGHGIKGSDPVGKMSDLTDLDRKYQRVGLIEWQRKCLCQERHMWAEEYAKLVRGEALSDLQQLPSESPPREVQTEGKIIESPADLVRRVEAEEIEFVLMEEIGAVERMLIEETLELEGLLVTEYADLVSNLGAKKPKNIERDQRKGAIIRIRSECISETAACKDTLMTAFTVLQA